MDTRIGSIVNNRYMIRGLSGKGGMSYVYKAYDLFHKNTVAIKFLNKSLTEDNKKIFNNEASILASLNHPYIVKVIDYGYDNNIPYIVSEYIVGQSLKNILDVRIALPLNETLMYVKDLCVALEYAHSRGVIHRDIKLENIFITPSGSVKLIDFGIAEIEGRSSESDIIFGSIYYVAPEILRKEKATVQSDIYSLGVAIFMILTGRPPFDNKTSKEIIEAHLRTPFPNIHNYLPNCPMWVNNFLQKACHKDLEERFKSVLEVRQYIENQEKDPTKPSKKKSFLARLFGFK